MIDDRLYTADEVKDYVSKAMTAYQKDMIDIIREVAGNGLYRNLTGEEALNRVANKLEGGS